MSTGEQAPGAGGEHPRQEYESVEVSGYDADSRHIVVYRADLDLQARRRMFERLAHPDDPPAVGQA
jgi:hypothetical protein